MTSDRANLTPMTRRIPDRYAPSPLDERARAVADRLHARSRRQLLPSVVPLAARAVRSKIRTGSWDFTQSPESKDWLADKLIALDPAKAALCYLLCRAIDARRVVEAGTSYGVSTIYLAAAVRDNIAASGGTGQVIGTEHETAKVAAAQRNLADAGLAHLVDVRDGDLRDSLQDVGGPVDFMLVDIWIPMALPALERVLPELRPGALVVCDEVVNGRKDYLEYLSLVRDPNGPFQSVTVPGQGGLEISMKRF
jgi:predicted O-methyltransferase YrrM